LDLNKNDIDYILQNHKWTFSWGDFFGRYFILIGPMGLVIASFVGFIRGVKESDEFTPLKWYVVISLLLLVGLTVALFSIMGSKPKKNLLA